MRAKSTHVQTGIDVNLVGSVIQRMICLKHQQGHKYLINMFRISGIITDFIPSVRTMYSAIDEPCNMLSSIGPVEGKSAILPTNQGCTCKILEM
jgi:hypothetical protein